MAFKILSARKYKLKPKGTIHASGRFGFTEATAKELKLTNRSAVKFAVDEDDNDALYLINCKTPDEDAFKVLKAGNYFSVNAKSLFDSLGLDYKNQNIMFDMMKVENMGEDEVYKLLKRDKPRKQKD